jgi:hypothetical protein
MEKEEDPFPLHSIKEREAPWEGGVRRHKDPKIGNPHWN